MRTLLALIVLSFLGCGGSESPKCHPVRGSVYRDGKPVQEAMVVLHPADETDELTQRPMGYTDEAGQFAITTFERGDGAPVGRYSVTVVQRAPKLVGEEMVREGPNLLPERLGEPTSSGISYSVIEGVNEMPRIEIPKR
jgi:hypothetical protein